MTTLPGLILKAQSGFFTVHTAQGDFVCQLRGRLKQKRLETDLAAVGDEVTISVQPEGTGMIEQVTPRRSVLSRLAPRGSKWVSDKDKEREQVIVANPDQVVLVFACANPLPRLRMLDRFLILAEVAHLPVLVCANKSDLISEAEAQALFGVYASLGYPTVYTSAKTGLGCNELRERLRNKISVLSGPSGVGKSSLLNAIQPGLGLRAREVSQATTKGRHTTVHPELLPLTEGGYVADTPGLRALGLWDIEPEELDGYFVEMQGLVAACEFNDCTHLNEPGCAVRQAVSTGQITASRYDSYCRLRQGEE